MTDLSNRSWLGLKWEKDLLVGLGISLAWVALMWVVWGYSALTGNHFGYLGVLPREWSGTIGILAAPWIHAKGLDHIAANSAPMFVLLAGVYYFYKPIFWKVVGWIYLITGVWTWAAARAVYHIGASGVVYGLAFFIFFSGVFRKDKIAIALALIVAFLYGGMFWGLFPFQEGVSWESHAFGALSGLLIAYWFKNVKTTLQEKQAAVNPYFDYPTHELWDYKSQVPPPEGFSYPEEE
ncbi:MAG: rhomboid family intramembrane serine protease [Bacteroidota bacterium]